MKKRQRHHLTGQAQVAGVLGACLFTILFPRLLWQRSPASSIPMAATPAPLPRGPSAVVLRMARQYRTRAKIAVNREREAIEAWDPQIHAGIDAEAWRLQLMAALPGGDLDCARAAARRAAVLARTPVEAGAAAELLMLIEHETGHHAAELRYARSLVELQPRQSRAWMLLRRAERCVASRRLGAEPRGAPIPAPHSAIKPLPVSSLQRPLPAAEPGRLILAAISSSPATGARAPALHPWRRLVIRAVDARQKKRACASAVASPLSGTGGWSLDYHPRGLSMLAAFGDGHGGEETGRTAASRTRATDARLDQKVWVHATNQRIGDLLAGLTRATGVTLVAHLEVADERVSAWAEDRSLKDLMRDLRHLHGYFWSRSKRGGQYDYSLWQDAQSRAREEAEVQRLAIEEQRQFAEGIRKHLEALNADEKELKRLAQADPYFVAQMIHPVVRAGYQLFATLSPDQQAQLLQGQTPSRGLPSGEVFDVSPLVSYSLPSVTHPDQTVTLVPRPESWLSEREPHGDVVTLQWTEMTPSQQAAVHDILRGAAMQQEKEAESMGHPGASRPSIDALRAADLQMTTVSLFRWGEAEGQGLSMRVLFQSEGRPWWLYSNIAVSAGSRKFYDDLLRKGEFRVWPGAQAEVDRYLGRKGGNMAAEPMIAPASAEPPDPLLDAPTSLAWRLPLRGGRPVLFSDELLDVLSRHVRRPLVLDSGYPTLRLPPGGSAEFRWDRRPLSELLHRLFPGWQVSRHENTIFLRDPDRLSGRLHQVPPAVEQLLKERKGPMTLDDAALLARDLSPWQLVRLFLPSQAIDEMLAAQDLLRLYGELAPGQRATLANGLSFAALTPPQQALFLQFAQRQRPFVEPWRFQHGGLRLVAQPPLLPRVDFENSPRPVARALFKVEFEDGDTQSLPIDLFAQPNRRGWPLPSDWIGKPFPFPPSTTPERQQENPTWKPVLADTRLRGRAAVVILSRPFVSPYVGVRPPPSPAVWARDLTVRLRDLGVMVLDVTLTAAEVTSDSAGGARPAIHQTPSRKSADRVIHLAEDGDEEGQPFDSTGSGAHVDQWPTVFIIDRDEVVRAVLEGQQAWDAIAIEAAARRVAPTGLPRASMP